MAFRRGSYTLTPPTWPIFAIATVLASLSALVRYKVVTIAALTPHTYEMMLIAAVMLIAAALFRGI
ncbi:hypothetical protein [uncultured Enterovirga sp.]|uniref:hypothetical protein n=1 Tax=uncultured Enterovirga sp. TaxID=2026352 RepID=UPI0035CBC1FF